VRNERSSLQQVGWIEAGNRMKKEEGVKVWWKQAGLVGGGVMLLYIDTFVDVDVENGYTCKYEMEERYGGGVNWESAGEH